MAEDQGANQQRQGDLQHRLERHDSRLEFLWIDHRIEQVKH
jgi:hypothetical protein